MTKIADEKLARVQATFTAEQREQARHWRSDLEGCKIALAILRICGCEEERAALTWYYDRLVVERLLLEANRQVPDE